MSRWPAVRPGPPLTFPAIMDTETSLILVGGPSHGARVDVRAEPGSVLFVGRAPYVVALDRPVAHPRLPVCPCGFSLERHDDSDGCWHWECPGCGQLFWFPTWATG